jgi:ribosomal protein S18 acetylase RimI-like enzyme
MITLLFSLLGLKWGKSKQVSNAMWRCFATLRIPVGTFKSTDTVLSSTGRGSYKVCPPSPSDAAGLQQLYNDDYVKAHIQMHPFVWGASTSDWEEALGPVDFEALIRDRSKDVRLLKCVEAEDSVPMEERPPLGYILYEFRTKGSPGKKPQRYCEVVNVVVGKAHQGSGLGRLLFQEMEADIEQSFKSHKGDLRLFVAKANARPMQWYRRLGFQDVGWQKESLGRAEVPFLRMTKK